MVKLLFSRNALENMFTKIKLAMRIIVLLTLFSVTYQFSFGETSPSPEAIDLFTSKEPTSGRGLNQPSDAFAPLEMVYLYAYVTYNQYPLENMLVTFWVTGPNIAIPSTDATNESGLATFSFRIQWPDGNSESSIFGEWNCTAAVQIGDVRVQDTLTFKVGWIVNIVSLKTINKHLQPQTTFLKGFYLGVELTLENIGMMSKNATLFLVVADRLNKVFGEIELELEAKPGETCLYFYGVLSIPGWASFGNATLTAVLYTRPPTQGGIAYSPGKLVEFTILGHDIAVTNIPTNASRVTADETVLIRSIVKNFGNFSETFDVKVFYDSNLIDTVSVINLAPQEEANLTFVWNLKNVAEGKYTIKAEAATVPFEYNMTNNVFLGSLLEVFAPKQDIAVTKAFSSCDQVYQGEMVDITVVVKNLGEKSGTFIVNVYANSFLIGSETVLSLTPDAEETLFFQWNTSNVVGDNYNIIVVADPMLGETAVSNNLYVDGVVKVLLKPSKPSSEIASWAWLLILLFIVALVMSIIFLLHKKRRKRSRSFLSTIVYLSNE